MSLLMHFQGLWLFWLDILKRFNKGHFFALLKAISHIQWKYNMKLEASHIFGRFSEIISLRISLIKLKEWGCLLINKVSYLMSNRSTRRFLKKLAKNYLKKIFPSKLQKSFQKSKSEWTVTLIVVVIITDNMEDSSMADMAIGKAKEEERV